MTHKLTVTVDIHEFGDARIAARSSKLGLTAYGSTEQEAIDTYRNLMIAILDHKESAEAIESYLDRHGVDWWRDDDDSEPAAPHIIDRGTRGRGAVLVFAA